MCTLSWLTTEAGYSVFCNRDERKTRPVAVPPAILRTGGVAYIAPIDPEGGGSWIAVNEQGQYRWKQSDLPSRVARQAARSAISRYFKVPPKEFVFLNRKLIGVYTFIAVLRAEFNGEPLLRTYLYGDAGTPEA